ncbi:MAG: DNA-binding protein [Eubacteriales bacterium]|nr:DNA-binding protein [Eubacteriales bacterium]
MTGFVVEKDFETVLLLDTYAGLLTKKQLRLCDMYYNQDYSLSEIAKIENTTRQAARDGIGKARQKLLHFEQCLGLCDKRNRTLKAVLKAQEPHPPYEEIVGEIADIWESDNGV